MWDVVALSVFILILYWFYISRLPSNFPPGPRIPLPIMGDLWRLGNDVPKAMHNLSLKYGKMIGLYFGPTPTVIIDDFDLITEAFSKDDFTDRPFFQGNDIFRGELDRKEFGSPGLIFSNGHQWVELRRFTLKTLRDYGMGKSGMEELVEQDVEELCKTLEEKNGQLVDPSTIFNVPVFNGLWKLMSNETYKHDDPHLLSMVDQLKRLTTTFQSPIVAMSIFYKSLMRLFDFLGFSNFTEIRDAVFKDYEEVIAKHEETFQEDNLRDLTDSIIQQRLENANNPNSSFHGRVGKLNQKIAMMDLFFAGSDTTSVTLNWAFLYMIMHPEIQKKVQEELDQVVGRGRWPTYGDKEMTPLTDAVIHETQRCASLTPLGLQHCTSRDIYLGGYYLPKGTQVLANLQSVLNDPKVFTNPEQFNPYRYYKDGKFTPHPKVIPFSVGKRRCLGEVVARVNLYRFFTNILHRFNVEKEPGVVLSKEAVPGFVLVPQKYLVKFIPRSN